MLILAIDTSTIAASVAIMDENKLHGEFYTDFKLKHSEKLLPMVDSLLHELHLTISEIDAFALTIGPGSFTGLRIGASTIKGFAHPLHKPIYTVSTLETCAYPNRYFQGAVCPILDAQRDAVYCAVFTTENGVMKRQTQDDAIPLNELIVMLEQYDRVMFCGDAVMKFREQLMTYDHNRFSLADAVSMMPKASSAASLALKMITDGMQPMRYDNILPQYIRKSQAEVNYQVKLK